MVKRKQLTFDIDTNVAKKILGEQNYTNIYANIRRFMEKEGWKHIEGSVYMSNKPLDNGDVIYLIQDMKKQYPYLDKCIREMHQTDISKIHSLNYYLEYDGTPGRYEQNQEQKERGHSKAPPSKPSVINKIEKNKEIIKQQESIFDFADSLNGCFFIAEILNVICNMHIQERRTNGTRSKN